MDNFQRIHEKMSVDYESLLESGQLSDFVMVAGGKELRVHKVILAARSRVFAAMFAHTTTKEAQESRVEIVDVDAEVLELLVRYIYTGNVEMLDHYALDLFVAADKYQLDCLKSICAEQLESQITTESASDLLLFANHYQVSRLYVRCADYIARNVNQVMVTEGWKRIVAKVDLLVQLYRQLHMVYSDIINSKKKKKRKVISEDVIRPDLLAKFCERLNWDNSVQLLLCPITIETVSNLLIIAYMHQANEIISKCLDYITDNVTWVAQQESWMKILTRADLMVLLFERLSLKYARECEKVLNDEPVA